MNKDITPLTVLDVENEEYMEKAAPVREEPEQVEAEEKPFKNYEMFNPKTGYYDADVIIKGIGTLGFDAQAFPRDAVDFCKKLDIDVVTYEGEDEIGGIVRPSEPNRNMIFRINEKESKSHQSLRAHLFALAAQWILVESKNESFSEATYKNFTDNVLNYSANLIMPLSRLLDDIRVKRLKADEIAKFYGIPKGLAQRKMDMLGF